MVYKEEKLLCIMYLYLNDKSCMIMKKNNFKQNMFWFQFFCFWEVNGKRIIYGKWYLIFVVCFVFLMMFLDILGFCYFYKYYNYLFFFFEKVGFFFINEVFGIYRIFSFVNNIFNDVLIYLGF